METKKVNFKLIIRFLMIFDFIFEHITILKQLPNFSFCRVFRKYPGLGTITAFQLMSYFETYPGFETITGIHINVNFQLFTH